jgi:hypothetical protein
VLQFNFVVSWWGLPVFSDPIMGWFGGGFGAVRNTWGAPRGGGDVRHVKLRALRSLLSYGQFQPCVFFSFWIACGPTHIPTLPYDHFFEESNGGEKNLKTNFLTKFVNTQF